MCEFEVSLNYIRGRAGERKGETHTHTHTERERETEIET